MGDFPTHPITQVLPTPNQVMAWFAVVSNMGNVSVAQLQNVINEVDSGFPAITLDQATSLLDFMQTAPSLTPDAAARFINSL